ncbi:SDR family oxidoreductase [Streptomyces globisporus]|uniref:SDR family oxidoreductase n=1 Tax=Streptomyces globisporus TaxID=1908 RepID=UPI00366072CD
MRSSEGGDAGVSGPAGPLTDADPEGMRQALEVNILDTCCAPAEPSAGGAIVNISSAAATLGSPGTYVHYAAAKAAVDAMTVGLSKEVAADGIRFDCVAPGTIRRVSRSRRQRKRDAQVKLAVTAGAALWSWPPGSSPRGREATAPLRELLPSIPASRRGR